ncbi:hypothetical protein F0562_032877 [Nyssa sinensis]|uniref:DUF4005 domain-containing protein n=1 Tax=Nyssa sinensis TaxID=561372 RepID=A0A5J5AT29_9ASTE|nr:hypothetical protein F0562_032877 [Nyssa sinensis]
MFDYLTKQFSTILFCSWRFDLGSRLVNFGLAVMGKSPGKWIKSVLFGKKASKSNLAGGREISKSASEKVALVQAKEPVSDLGVHPPLISQPVYCSGAGIGENSENGVASRLPNDEVVLYSAKQDGDAQKTTNLGSPKDSKRIGLEEAATSVQAAFRGYLARRAFQVLKGIIRLQALIRGHLVRRQAVATLYCVNRIVKLQALVRGQKVRRSDIGSKVHKKQGLGKLDPKCLDSFETNTSNQVEKLLVNAFVCKLLSSSHTTVPLYLQYGPGEPNSAWEWLRRWTMSHVWGHSSQPKIIDLKPQTKDGSFQTVEAEQGRPKRSVQRLPTANVDSVSDKSALESEKLKRNQRKVSNHTANSVKEHPQNETEKGVDDHAEKAKRDIGLAVPGRSYVETSPKSLAADVPADELHVHSAIDLQPKQINGRNEDIPLVDKSLSSKHDDISNEYQKTSRRRASLPAKQDYQENGLHKTPRVPSYMATTESAKAKFRGQLSPRFGQDEAEKNGLTRRHSLPTSANGKLSLSPRVQRLVQASGKGGIRSDRSLLSSTDEKAIQAEWRR